MRKILCLLPAVMFYSFFCPFFDTFNCDVYEDTNVSITEKLYDTVIIDPGHGGDDGGATGIGGISEKHFNLSVAMKMRDIFLISGYNVEMTRTEDCDTDGKIGFHKKEDIFNRKSLGDKYPAAVFLSVHMNASSSANDKGFQVFYGTSNSKSVFLADGIRNLMLNANIATRIRELKQTPDTVYLMKNLKNPCILLECGFVSNKEDFELLSESSYRQKLALIFFSASNTFCSSEKNISGE